MKGDKFPLLTMVAAIIFGAIAIYAKNPEGLAFASGLTTAAGTAYQHQVREED